MFVLNLMHSSLWFQIWSWNSTISTFFTHFVKFLTCRLHSPAAWKAFIYTTSHTQCIMVTFWQSLIRATISKWWFRTKLVEKKTNIYCILLEIICYYDTPEKATSYYYRKNKVRISVWHWQGRKVKDIKRWHMLMKTREKVYIQGCCYLQ